ncbi:MAG: hypothetical protein WCJ36_00935 [Candidatus Saccharibacteria bacterium]
MKNIRLYKLTFGIISVVTIGGLFSIPVSAQAASPNVGQGLEISPALVELNASRGKTYYVNLNVLNVTTSDLTYDSAVNDFNATSETGSPHVIMGNNSMPSTASVVTWVSVIPEFTLHSRQNKAVAVQINIPANAEPGGHYGVIRFSGRAPEVTDTGVGLSASAGVLLLIRVDGVINEKASLSSFFSSRNGEQNFFFENSPIDFVTRIKNEGNIHLKPTGSIALRDMFGNVVTTIPVNNDKSNVLPASTRRFESQYKSSWMIGRYTADLTIGYGTTGQAITNTISFWVIPYRIILSCLFILATIVFIFSRLIKVYNKHIIEKAKNENKIENKKDTKEKPKGKK